MPAFLKLAYVNHTGAKKLGELLDVIAKLILENIAVKFPENKEVDNLLSCLQQPRLNAHMRSNAQLEAAQKLKCKPSQLDFLFDKKASPETLNEIFDFPDSERGRLSRDAYIRYTAQ